MNTPDAFIANADTRRQQMDMAKNVGRLKTIPAKQQQVRMLCKSLTRSIRGK